MKGYQDYPPLQQASPEEQQRLMDAIIGPRPEPNRFPKMPSWMRATGGCEITLADEVWSRNGHEIH